MAVPRGLSLHEIDVVLECVVTSEIVLDKLSFATWVAGGTAADAAREKEKDLAKWLLTARPPHRIENAFDPKWRMARNINMHECAEQFQFYEWITPFLNEPTQFRTQSVFVLHPSDVAHMIEAYYSYDEIVMRDILGKPLTKAASRDMQEQAVDFRTKVFSIRRQFDNVKRILTRVEQEIQSTKGQQSPSERTVLTIIKEDFRLPGELASQYEHIAFLCYNKIETSKSRLNLLDYSEWSAMAAVVKAMWGAEDSLDLDVEFTDMMRVAKEALSAREVSLDFRKHVMALFKASLHDSDMPHTVSNSMATLGKEQLYYRHMLSALEKGFVSIARAIAQIGAGLQEWREIRDLFVDVNEKVLTPLDAADMTLEQVVTLFSAMDKAIGMCGVTTKSKMKTQPQWAPAWRKCVEGIKMLAVTMYPQLFGRHA